ncbi:MAG TPA: DUF4350 domain-containing protein [Puia sp.]|nr:DUF4350 domain-containing protein [Puia sp.]
MSRIHQHRPAPSTFLYFRRHMLLLLLLSVCFSSCTVKQSKELNRRITLWRKDKIPYGTELAYDGLPYLFPNAAISVNKSSPTTFRTGEGKKAYIIIVSSMDPKPSEVTALLNFVGEGNHVFISAHHVADTLLHTLGLKAGRGLDQGFEPDSLRLNLLEPEKSGYQSFAYPGDAYDNWVTSLDSQYAVVMGRDSRDRPDFIKLTYKSGGTIYLQLAPLAFSNFFLLYKNNRAYYEHALSNLPGTVGEVMWDDYFRYGDRDFSSLQYILGYKDKNGNQPLAWAFWLLLALLAFIYLFDSKRRQRMVPLISPLRNTSVDFVRTIGRLYFQRRDNHNLATKMTAHFLDQVRTRYHMASTNMDDDFIDRLSYRTGYPKEPLTQLVEYMQRLPDKAYVPDEELLDFHRQLEAFYKSV